MDKFTALGIVVDRYGREHKVYPAKLVWKDEIRRLTVRFNDAQIISNLLNYEVDKDTGKPIFEDDELVYNDQAFDALMDIIVFALDEKETKEQILQWIDVALVREIIEVFYDISNLKKNGKIATE